MSKSIPPPKKLSSNYHYATQQVYNDVDNFESYSDSANLYVKTFEEIKIKHIICCIKDCFKKVKFECRCSTKPTFICKRHLPSHVKENKTHAPTVFDSKIHKKK